MEQTIHSPETYDFRKYDQIWQRVAPNLEPYPDLREPAVPAVPPLPSGGTASGAPAVPAAETLPGAEQDPCCMGTAARVPGSIVHQVLSVRGRNDRKIIIGHPAGVIPVVSELEAHDGQYDLKTAAILRTARIILDGQVYVRKSRIQ